MTTCGDLMYMAKQNENSLYHNLEYGDNKSGPLEDWLMKKRKFFICMQSKKFKKELML